MSFSKIILGCEQIGGKDHGYVNKKVLRNIFLNSLKFGINTFVNCFSKISFHFIK